LGQEVFSCKPLSLVYRIVICGWYGWAYFEKCATIMTGFCHKG
jgi:hypothetical protein